MSIKRVGWWTEDGSSNEQRSVRNQMHERNFLRVRGLNCRRRVGSKETVDVDYEKGWKEKDRS